MRSCSVDQGFPIEPAVRDGPLRSLDQVLVCCGAAFIPAIRGNCEICEGRIHITRDEAAAECRQIFPLLPPETLASPRRHTGDTAVLAADAVVDLRSGGDAHVLEPFARHGVETPCLGVHPCDIGLRKTRCSLICLKLRIYFCDCFG